MKLIIFLLMINSAYAAKRFVIYTDQPGQAKANGLAEYMRTAVPFNEFDIEYVVESMPTSDLGCERNSRILRLIECNDFRVKRRARRAGYDQAFIVLNDSRWGGGGGDAPVITTVENVPYSMMIHEYLHTIGFGDEYTFGNSQEADRYCTSSIMRRYINLALIEPRQGGYDNDAHARRLHDDDIPWYGLIETSVPITSGSSLGTPGSTSGSGSYGLFPAQTCVNASNPRKRHVWKPGSETSIMNDATHEVSELAPLIRIALQSQNFPEREGGAIRRERSNAQPPPVVRNYEFTSTQVQPTCSLIERNPTTNSNFSSSIDDFEAINNVIINGVSSSTTGENQNFLLDGSAANFTSVPVRSSGARRIQKLNLPPVEYRPRGKIDNPYMKIDFLNPNKQ